MPAPNSTWFDRRCAYLIKVARKRLQQATTSSEREFWEDRLAFLLRWADLTSPDPFSEEP
jgi:hypothetical protein